MNLNTRILKSLFFLGTTAIGELSNAIGKSVPITTKGIKDLVKKGLVLNLGLSDSTGGRKAYLYTADKDKMGHIIAVAIERKKTQIDVFNIDKEKVIETIEIHISINEAEKLRSAIVEQLQHIKNSTKDQTYMGIGIISPGFVDAQKKINTSHTEDSPLYNISSYIEEKLDIPTFIENDSTAIALVEMYFGNTKNASPTLVINLTWGVGLGILINNSIFKGFKGFAGEFSHIPLADTDTQCLCGKKGCLEVEASLQTAITYIEDKIAAGENSILKGTNEITFEQLAHAYNAGDALTIEAIKKIGHMLGKGIATLIHILNPEKIILAGKGIVFGDIILEEVQSSIHLYCIPRLSDQTQIEVSALDNVLTLAAASTVVYQIPKINVS